MSNEEGHAGRRTQGIIGTHQAGNAPREEPWRNYSGWKCTHCGSGNTIIEEYTSELQGRCMTCARDFDIPRDKLEAYERSRGTNPTSS